MAEHDPEAFQELFDSEPAEPTGNEAAEWVGLYTRLVDLLERQLQETRQFSAAMPDALREYLGRENIKILEEELAVFHERLAHWRSIGP